MISKKDFAHTLRLVARCENLSDGAKVTLVELISHFWSEDKTIPSYSELCKIRGVSRSTIQTHIEELERSRVVVSVRLPNNRKRYSLKLDVLEVKVSEKKVTRKPVKLKGSLNKNTAKFKTHELCTYFCFLRSKITGNEEKSQRQHYVKMRKLHREHGSTEIIAAMDYHCRIYKRRKFPFTLDWFLDNADKKLFGRV